jgi:hypothetical protein
MNATEHVSVDADLTNEPIIMNSLPMVIDKLILGESSNGIKILCQTLIFWNSGRIPNLFIHRATNRQKFFDQEEAEATNYIV